MPFLKIKDPKKRDALVAEFLKTKNKIQNDFPSERLGEQSIYEDFWKIFKYWRYEICIFFGVVSFHCTWFVKVMI